MEQVVLVKIASRRDLFHFKTSEPEIKPRDKIIVRTMTGEELGTVVRQFGADFQAKICCIPPIIRKASVEDEENFAKKEEEEKRAFRFCLERIKEREFPIKLIRVVFFNSERKAVFYFTSEGRIDFRELVKDLAKKIKMRIEMRQIGVRDEAKMIGGLGICGRQLCCKIFLANLEPITLQMAKKQNLNMNPLKISGQCGRLMCCLSYEETGGGRVFIEDGDERIGYNEEEELTAEGENSKA